MSSTIQIRVDDDLKTKADELFKELGTDTTSAIRIFLAQAVASNGFPFTGIRIQFQGISIAYAALAGTKMDQPLPE